MDCSLPGFSIHEIFQARVLEWVAIAFSTDSWGAQQNLVCTRIQEKGTVISQETDPDLPVTVQESLVEVWVYSGLLQGRGTENNSPGSCRELA